MSRRRMAKAVATKARRSGQYLGSGFCIAGRFSDSLEGHVARAGLSGAIAGAAMLVLFAIAFATVLAISPVLARQAGVRDGRLALAQLSASSKGKAAPCDTIKSGGPWVRPHVIAFADDTVAVLDAGVVHRMARKDSMFATALPADAAASR